MSWRAPPGCPSASQAEAQIRRLVGTIRPGTVPVRAEVEISSGGPRSFAVRISTQRGDEQGERSFEGTSCRQVTTTSALILSMLLEPVQTTESLVPPEARPEEPAEPAPAAMPPAAPDPRDDGASPVRLFAGALGALDRGSLPALAPGLGVGVGLEAGRGWLEARGVAFLPRRGERGPRAGTGVEAGMWVAGATGCWTALPGSQSVAACVGLEGGVMSAEGVGLTQPRQASGGWFAGTVGLRLVPRSSATRAWLALDVGAPLLRPTFIVEGFGEVHRASLPLVRLGLGVFLPVF